MFFVHKGCIKDSDVSNILGTLFLQYSYKNAQQPSKAPDVRDTVHVPQTQCL